MWLGVGLMMAGLLLFWSMSPSLGGLQSQSTTLPSVIDILNSELEYVGNPFMVRYPNGSGWEYARSVWDMQVWNNRIYFGHGNAMNEGPATNAGPIDVWYYDPSRDVFVKEFTVDEEQIDKYRVFNGILYIPGCDPRESPDWGNFYYNDGAGWVKKRTIPGLTYHTNDIWESDDKLFAAGSPWYIHISSDHGDTWVIGRYPVLNFLEFFELNDRLYAYGCCNVKVIYEYANGSFSEVTGVDVFPSSRVYLAPIVAKSVNFKGVLVYLQTVWLMESESAPWNYFVDRVGIYKAQSMSQSDIQRLTFLQEDEKPYDILVHEGTIYVLASSGGGSSYTMKVYASTDLSHWEEKISFSAHAPAYSFEYLDGYFYFGLGGDNPHSGDIYRYHFGSASDGE